MDGNDSHLKVRSTRVNSNQYCCTAKSVEILQSELSLLAIRFFPFFGLWILSIMPSKVLINLPKFLLVISKTSVPHCTLPLCSISCFLIVAKYPRTFTFPRKYSYNPVLGMLNSLQSDVCCMFISICLLLCRSLLHLVVCCAFSASTSVCAAVSLVLLSLSSAGDDSAAETVKQISASVKLTWPTYVLCNNVIYTVQEEKLYTWGLKIALNRRLVLFHRI